MKRNKGITLIALVITIIIIIILSTVTINMTFGENGLLKKAQLAKDLTANSIYYDSEELTNLMANINEIFGEHEIQNPDTTAPTIEITQGEITENSIEIIVIATDISGIQEKGYEYFINGESKGTVDENRYVFTDLTSSTEYTIKVVVKDTKGNAGEKEITIRTAEPQIPEAPTEYQWYQTIVQSNYTFTSDKDQWIRVHVVGDGGDGGDGGNGDTYTESDTERDYNTRGGGGGGGATGGYAIHDVYLNQGDIITVTRTGSRWQIQIDDTVVYANHGGNGSSGSFVLAYDVYYHGTFSMGTGGKGGKGGTAGGGNVLNLQGNNGTAGNYKDGGASASGNSSAKYQSKAKLAGGNGASSTGNGANGGIGKSATGSTNGASTLLGGAGSGGGGGSSYVNYYDGPKGLGGAGGSGYTGGVVIEIGQ